MLLGAENRVFLILPLNVAAAMPPELEFFSPIVWEELELYLRAHDKQLKTVSRQIARKLWIEEHPAGSRRREGRAGRIRRCRARPGPRARGSTPSSTR